MISKLDIKTLFLFGCLAFCISCCKIKIFNSNPENVGPVKSEELLSLYRKDERTEKIAQSLGNSSKSRIHLTGLISSARSLLAATVFGQTLVTLNHLKFILLKFEFCIFDSSPVFSTSREDEPR